MTSLLFSISLFHFLFHRLCHHFQASHRSPDNHDEPRLEEMKNIESEHHHSADRDEDRLTQTCIHRRHTHITSVVDLLHEEDDHREDTRTCKKYRCSHQDNRSSDILFRTHIIEQEKCWRRTREKDDQEDEKIRLEAHERRWKFDRMERTLYNSEWITYVSSGDSLFLSISFFLVYERFFSSLSQCSSP